MAQGSFKISKIVFLLINTNEQTYSRPRLRESIYYLDHDTWVHFEANETWVHFEPESKRASIEWRHPTSPRSKNFKSQQSAGKVMVTLFWDSFGVVLVDFMSKGAIINSDAYINSSTCFENV